MSSPLPLETGPGLPMSVLPRRDGDPDSPSFGPSEASTPAQILECAEALCIPWRRILLGEIDSEQRLRRYVADVETRFSLRAAISILSFSLLKSWRIRDEIESLACQARGAANQGAVRQLRIVLQRLTGRGDRDQVALAEHLWFAYQRVLLLHRVRLAAARSRGTTAERLAFTCSRARCSFDDAAWAVCQEDSTGRGHRLDAAVRKVRDEGFLIPRAPTEARSLAELRRIVLSSPYLQRRRRSRSAPRETAAAPRRVRLPFSTMNAGAVGKVLAVRAVGGRNPEMPTPLQRSVSRDPS